VDVLCQLRCESATWTMVNETTFADSQWYDTGGRKAEAVEHGSTRELGAVGMEGEPCVEPRSNSEAIRSIDWKTVAERLPARA